MHVVLVGCDARRSTRRSASTERGVQRSSAPSGVADVHKLFWLVTWYPSNGVVACDAWVVRWAAAW
jgi:hypothetical protein